MSITFIDKKYLGILVTLLSENDIYVFTTSENKDNEIIILTCECDQVLLDDLANQAHGGFYDYILVSDVLDISKAIDIDVDLETGESIDNCESVIGLLDLKFINNNRQTAIEAALDKWEYQNSFTRDESDLS